MNTQPSGERRLTVMADMDAEIKSMTSRFIESFKARDYDAISQMYTKDCVYMPPGEIVIKGRENTRAVFAPFHVAGAETIKFNRDDLFQGSGHATERASFRMFRADGTLFDAGKHILVWKEEDGRLKMHIDMWSSDTS